MQWLMYHKAQWQLNYGVDEDGNGVAQKLKGEQKKQWEALRKQLAAFDDIKPKPLPVGSGITDVGAEAPATYVLKGGGYDAFGEEVQPGFLTIFDRGDAKITPSKIEHDGPPHGVGELARRSRQSVDRSRDGQPHLALPLRTRHRRHDRAISARCATAKLIVNCWIG